MAKLHLNPEKSWKSEVLKAASIPGAFEQQVIEIEKEIIKEVKITPKPIKLLLVVQTLTIIALIILKHF